MGLVDSAIRALAYPLPYRILLLRRLLRMWPVGSYHARLYAGGVHRPNYGWCVYHAALEASALGHKAMTVVEFGVAGGNGLLNLCGHAEEIGTALGIEIVVVGFDSGAGLPATRDSRDMMYFWPTGSFEMDRSALEKRLQGRASLVLGNVSETVTSWQPGPDAPVGAILFDLDFYTSTTAALGIFLQDNLLPRVWCYFDDICGYPPNAIAEGIGEREAVKQFNLDPQRKLARDLLSPAYVFKGMTPEAWHQQIYLYHRMSHPAYDVCLSAESKQQLPLDQ